MHFVHEDCRYEIDDEWWREAGMVDFVPTRRSFRAEVGAHPDRPIFEIPICDVEPLCRQLSHGVFNDGPSGTAHERVTRWLRRFVADASIPPVELVRLPSDAHHRFRLYDGTHRFYCAVAAGFSYVPAVDVTEPNVTEIDFDEIPGKA